MDRRMEEYRAQGHTVFEGLYDETTVQTWRDEHLQGRANSGFQQPDEAPWHLWVQNDRRALEEAARRE